MDYTMLFTPTNISKFEQEKMLEIEHYKREQLKILLDYCNDQQQIFFFGMYKSLEELQPHQINRAIEQVLATVKINREIWA